MSWFKNIPKKKKKEEKYKNEKQFHAGHSFASKGEAQCYDQLCWQEKAGEIKILGKQVSVYLTKARVQYIADFHILEIHPNKEAYVEFKGFETDVWRIKRRLWLHYGPAPLHIWKKNRIGLYLDETIFPKRGSEDGNDTEQPSARGTELAGD